MMSKEECEKAYLNIAFSTGTRKCEYNSLCDECLNECETHKQYEKDCEVIEQLIKEHFELVEKYNRLYDECPQKCEMLKQLQDEVDKYKHEYFAMCDLFENPQPYKFEDLKVGMWVWDNVESECIRVLKTYITDDEHEYYTPGVKVIRTGYEYNWQEIGFRENRFFPVQIANVGCE